MPGAVAAGIVRYLVGAPHCWWSVRRICAVLPHTEAAIQAVLELFWRQGRLRRKRGPGGEYEYQVRFVERA